MLMFALDEKWHILILTCNVTVDLVLQVVNSVSACFLFGLIFYSILFRFDFLFSLLYLFLKRNSV